MDPWTVGLVALIAVGLAVIVYGALSDRSKNRRRAAEMLSPPQREIPRFSPAAPSPHYLSELQARRAPQDTQPTDLTKDERTEITRQLTDPATVSVDAGYISHDFVTDQTAGWAVLEHPRIMVCAAPVQTVRELLPVLERLILSGTPLVIVAPGFSPGVRSTLEVNAIQATMPLLAVAAEQDQAEQIAKATGAAAIARSDLQAGFVRLEDLGRCDRWVSSRRTSHLIGRRTSGTDPVTAPDDAGSGVSE